MQIYSDFEMIFDQSRNTFTGVYYSLIKKNVIMKKSIMTLTKHPALKNGADYLSF